MKLKVAEAIHDDINKGIVRIDSGIIAKLGAKEGDIVMIKGKKATVATLFGGYLGDEGMDLIRMDGITRRNAETGISETVSVKKADPKEAKIIIISPAREDIHVSIPQNLLKQGLLGKAVVKGDIITLTGTETTSKIPFFEDIFPMLDGKLGFGDIKFIVENTTPYGIVKATNNTQIALKEGKKRKNKTLPLKYSKSKKTLTIRRKILAKAIGVKPKDIEKVILK
ncbi:hypothetical protein COV19_03480 [Candidatus Woesearchaeota archaeon CG10_big_fil_rev_8_21_14_0_10_44_13]|nr:MAG: hypothetical protein COV19_03480 [Candidatus Woesearchaeota archaeon CG10_big_fil_rev_8_21_14_0_10_44_13]